MFFANQVLLHLLVFQDDVRYLMTNTHETEMNALLLQPQITAESLYIHKSQSQYLKMCVPIQLYSFQYICKSFSKSF